MTSSEMTALINAARAMKAEGKKPTHYFENYIDGIFSDGKAYIVRIQNDLRGDPVWATAVEFTKHGVVRVHDGYWHYFSRSRAKVEGYYASCRY